MIFSNDPWLETPSHITVDTLFEMITCVVAETNSNTRYSQNRFPHVLPSSF